MKYFSLEVQSHFQTFIVLYQSLKCDCKKDVTFWIRIMKNNSISLSINTNSIWFIWIWKTYIHTHTHTYINIYIYILSNKIHYTNTWYIYTHTKTWYIYTNKNKTKTIHKIQNKIQYKNIYDTKLTIKPKVMSPPQLLSWESCWT